MAKFCGKCGSKLDENTGLCPNCDMQKKQRKKYNRRVRKAEQQKAKKAYNKTLSFWQKLRGVFGRLVLCLAVILLFVSIVAFFGGHWGIWDVSKVKPESEQLPETTACVHAWSGEATCMEPKICTLCGEIAQEALWHQWVEATYTIPKTCMRCGLTEGTPKCNPGETFQFGRFEQDNKKNNGPEEITWIILKVEPGKVLAISRDGLEAMKYHSTLETVDWAECDVHNWLNDDFYNTAFTDEEKNMMLDFEWGDSVSILAYLELDDYENVLDRWTWDVSKYAQSRYHNTEVIPGNWWWDRNTWKPRDEAGSFWAEGTKVTLPSSGPVNHGEGFLRPIILIDLDAYYKK